MTTRFPARPPRLRMLAVAVALLAVALLLAVGSVVALWAVVASNRRTLRDQDAHVTKLAGQVSALEAQVRGLDAVPVTRTTTTTTTAPPGRVPGTATTARSTTPAAQDAPAPNPLTSTSTTTATSTTSTTSTTTTAPLLCLGGLGVGCLSPNGRGHPALTVAVVVRSAATTPVGRHP